MLNQSIFLLFPLAAITPWDTVEIHPIVKMENGDFEVVQEGKESFWSVFASN